MKGGYKPERKRKQKGKGKLRAPLPSLTLHNRTKTGLMMTGWHCCSLASTPPPCIGIKDKYQILAEQVRARGSGSATLTGKNKQNRELFRAKNNDDNFSNTHKY